MRRTCAENRDGFIWFHVYEVFGLCDSEGFVRMIVHNDGCLIYGCSVVTLCNPSCEPSVSSSVQPPGLEISVGKPGGKPANDNVRKCSHQQFLGLVLLVNAY